MGRPIKKKFFGNLNNPDHGSVVLGSGVGGEGVGTVIIVGTTGTNYSQGAVAVFSAPNIVGGTTATGTLTIGTPAAQGRITAVTLTDPGAGYTSTATISITTASAVTAASTGNGGITATNTFTVASVTGIYIGMVIAGGATGNNGKVTAIDTDLNRITSTVNNLSTWADASNLTFNDYGSGFKAITTVTSTVLDAIQIISYLPTASQSRTGGDIIKQESSRRYLVQNADGVGICRLATNVLTAGQMHIIATDWTGASYYVTKLTAHKATVVNRYNTSTAIYTTGQVAPWTIGDTTGTYVTLSNTI
jgi:hypothetical protein